MMQNSALKTIVDVVIGIFSTMRQQYLEENDFSDSEFCWNLWLCMDY